MMKCQIEDLQNENDFLSQQLKYIKKVTTKDFNSVPLKMQHFILTEAINNEDDKNQEVFLYFIKINNLMLFLLQFKELETVPCIQIDINENIILQTITKEYPIILLSGATKVLFNKNELLAPQFLNSLKEFSFFSFDIRYPSSEFEEEFKFAHQKLLPYFPDDQIKINVFITGGKTDYKFNNNKQIKYIRLDTSVNEIIGGLFSSSFNSCTSLIEVSIPNSVSVIGCNAFYGCNLLKEIVIPSSVTFIQSKAFEKCTSLEKIIIPFSVKQIGGSICANCSSLYHVIFLADVKSIPSYTFYKCISLKQIQLPNSIELIESNAFTGCSSLEHVFYNSNILIWSFDAFNDCHMFKNSMH